MSDSVRELLLVRHGESLGNVAANAADQVMAPMVDIGFRDADVELSQTGSDQARALGLGLASLPRERRPDAVWCSPYRRAVDTARLALQSAGLGLEVQLDERLRDRDLGVLDLLTRTGIDQRMPAEAARRQWLGKFYYRPPGGESWTDLALRVRFFLNDLDRLEPGRRVLVVCHDVVVLMFRYICEQMTEQEVLATGQASPILNTAVTTLTRDQSSQRWVLGTSNDVSHLDLDATPVTGRPGDPDVQA